MLADRGVECWLNRSPGRRLTKVLNGIGGFTTIAYATNTSGFGQNLPLALDVVSSISVDDGNGHISETNYQYSGGMYNVPTRDFRGFNRVEVAQPPDEGVGRREIIWFHQGNDFAPDSHQPSVPIGRTKGKWYQRETRDLLNNVYQRSRAWYTRGADTGPTFFDPLGRIEASICGSVSSMLSLTGLSFAS